MAVAGRAEDLGGWRDALEAAIACCGAGLLERAVVLAETASTQDAARAHAAGRPGLVVLAGRQTAGRGRLGRRWVQAGDTGLAMSLVLDPSRVSPEHVSLAAGVAAAEAVQRAAPKHEIGVRWPNDVVERGAGRKVAGVLIEREGALMILGVGINVAQGPADWPPDLRGRAVSVRELGGDAARIVLAAEFIRHFASCAALPDEELVTRWGGLDVLRGRRAAFVSDGRRIEGVVESIEPSTRIRVLLDSGERVTLPALTTSLAR